MNYFIFNNSIIMSDGEKVEHIEKNAGLDQYKFPLDKASVCVVDVDIAFLFAAGDQDLIDKTLVREFEKLYTGDYILQDERVDSNLFQTMGIKEQKVREVYSFVSPDKVVNFVPYGVALRNVLAQKNIGANKPVVFVDDLGKEKLLTAFDGAKFSKTRVIVSTGDNILPEIKRSQIDFSKKTENILNKKSSEFLIVVNSKKIADEIAASKESLQVELLDVPYPAIEGMKELNTSIKYILPEVNLKKRKEVELKERVRTLAAASVLAGLGIMFYLFTQVQVMQANNSYSLAQNRNQKLNDELNELSRETYRADLKAQKTLNYGMTYLSVVNDIPASYLVNAFKFYKTDTWNIEMTLLVDDKGTFDDIPKIKLLKSAEIKNIFVNSQPGKHIKISL